MTVALLLAGLAACGGGGGGGDGSASVSLGGGGDGGGDGAANNTGPLSYSGRTDAASVSTTNAAQLTADVLGDGTASSAISSLGGTGTAASSGLPDLGSRLNRAARSAFAPRRPGGTGLSAPIPIDLDMPCDSGSVRTTGTLSDSGTGTLSIAWNDCRTGTDTLSGAATMRVDAFNLTSFTITDYTVEFERLTLRASGTGVDLTGSVRAQVDIAARTETITVNIVALQSGGRMTKSENVVLTDVFNDLAAPTSYLRTVSGRVFDSAHGFFDITTLQPLAFGTLDQSFPHSGAIQLTGGGGVARATALSADLVKLELNLNGDSVFETAATLRWTDLSGPVGADPNIWAAATPNGA